MKIRAIFLLPLAGMMLSCGSPQKAKPQPEKSALAPDSNRGPQLRERLDSSPAWREDPKAELLSLLGDILGPSFAITVDEFRWEPGSGEGSGLRIGAREAGAVLQKLQFEEFSIGETDFGFEMTAKGLSGSVHIELVEDGPASQIAVAISAEDLLAPESVDIALGKHRFAGDISLELELVLTSANPADSNSRAWQLGDVDVGVITSKSGLTLLRPEVDSSIPLGRPALIANWDSAKRRLEIGGGFRGEGRGIALTAVAATHDPATDSFRLEGKLDTARPQGSYQLSGSILSPVLTADAL